MSRAAAALEVHGWAQLRHGGLLLDPQRLSAIARFAPAPLEYYVER